MALLCRGKPIVAVRAVHLDLKGLPPTPARLIELLEVFKAAGLNAVLVEWEDTFPWTVDERFRGKAVYAPEEVARFHEVADGLGLEIIPLVQCLGHLETPLSVPAYAHLREVPYRPDVINPLAPGARELIERMIEDVLELTPGVRHFHLGGDEAWTFGTHPDTKAFIEEHGAGALYLHHVEPLLDRLNERGIRPLLWHDMMRDWHEEALRDLARKADLVVWGYQGHPDTTTSHFSTEVIERFKAQGVPMWAGTAYKSGVGPDADLPDIATRQENALAWAEVAERYGFRGIIATGWARYSTGRMQMVPIDSALDALLDVAVILHDGQPPEGGLDACVAALESIGEGDRFATCQAAMQGLTDRRQSGWRHVAVLREQLVTAGLVARDAGAWSAVRYRHSLHRSISYLDEAAAAVRQAFEGLIPTVSIEDYLAERVEPLREEFQELDRRTRALAPEIFEALGP